MNWHDKNDHYIEFPKTEFQVPAQVSLAANFVMTDMCNQENELSQKEFSLHKSTCDNCRCPVPWYIHYRSFE